MTKRSSFSTPPPLTPWFPCDVKPVRRGLYLRDVWMAFANDFRESYSFWNGEFWGGWAKSKRAAFRNRIRPSVEQRARWRGLARKP